MVSVVRRNVWLASWRTMISRSCIRHSDNAFIRVGDWKLVAAKGDSWELYNLETDRRGTNNVAKQCPDKALKIAIQWQGMLESFADQAADAPCHSSLPSEAK